VPQPLQKYRQGLIPLLMPCYMAMLMPELRYILSCMTSLPRDQYQIILLGDRGTCVSKTA